MNPSPDIVEPTLVVRARDGTHRTFALSDKPLTLGRAVTCDVVLRDDGGVSREHAHVWLDEGGRVLVADQGSKNGTRVDAGDLFRHGTHIATRSIRIGEYEIDVLGAATPGVTDETQVRFAPEDPQRTGQTHFFPSSKRLDLNEQRLALLMSLTERIGGTFERKQLLEQALDACCEALGFERGLIALKTARGEPELPVTRNVQRDETGAFKISRTLINQALIHGERAVVNNPATDLVDNLTESLVRFPICSALCVPVLHREEILGVIYGDRITQASTYSPADVDFLAAIAQQVGLGLANLRFFQEHLRAQKMYVELDQARRIQRGLLPARPLQLGRVVIGGYNEPSSAVGGDYFDYFDLGGGHVGVLIADVTGHGLPAALMMANMQAAARVALTTDNPLTEVAARLNRLTYTNTGTDVFVTAILGRIDVNTGELEYISAGHPGPLLLKGRKVEIVDGDNSLPFGVLTDDTYVVQRIAPDSDLRAVLFYTDGLVEAENADGEMCAEAPIVKALAKVKDATPANVMQAAIDTVNKHVGHTRLADDMTLLVVSFPGAERPA